MSEENLESKLRDLYIQEATLSSDLRAERKFREKRKIEIEKGKVYVQIQELQRKRDEEINKNAIPTTDKMLKENESLIYVSANQSKLEISEKLEVQILFSCGKHTKKIHIRELLRNPDENNVIMLERWKRIIQHKDIITYTLRCEQCQREKEGIRAKFHRNEDTPIGRTVITVRLLQ